MKGRLITAPSGISAIPEVLRMSRFLRLFMIWFDGKSPSQRSCLTWALDLLGGFVDST
jgi:hypothetical protein